MSTEYVKTVWCSDVFSRISKHFHSVAQGSALQMPKITPFGSSSPKYSTPRKDHTHLEQAGDSDSVLPANERCYFNQRAKVISWEQCLLLSSVSPWCMCAMTSGSDGRTKSFLLQHWSCREDDSGQFPKTHRKMSHEKAILSLLLHLGTAGPREAMQAALNVDVVLQISCRVAQSTAPEQRAVGEGSFIRGWVLSAVGSRKILNVEVRVTGVSN